MFAAGLTAVACSDSAAPVRQPLALAGTWVVSDTFGLTGTITLADASIGDGIRDTLDRWIAAYDDTLSVMGFAMGSGSFAVRGKAAPAQRCGLLIVKQWQYPRSASANGARSDTLYSLRMTCDALWAGLLTSVAPASTVASLQLPLIQTDMSGLVDTGSVCLQAGCPSPYAESLVTLTRQ